MKKLLLLALGAVCMTANAQTWTADITGIFSENKPVYAAETAIANDGSVIVTGALTTDATIAGNQLEAVGTSAYLAKYNSNGTPAWAIAFTGSATITALTTDAEGNIYVAGRYADEVTLGSTDDNTQTVEGIQVWGDYISDQDASFIARYTPAGVLSAATSFVPEENEDAAKAAAANSDGFYYSTRRFIINNIHVDGSKFYGSALYAGQLTKDNAKFIGTYNDPWDGSFITDLTSTCIFSVNAADFTGCESIVTSTTQGYLATENDQYSAISVSFAVSNGNVYAIFSGNGPLQYTTANGKRTSDAAFSTYNYTFAEISAGTITQFAEIACPEAGFNTDYTPNNVIINGSNLYAVGNEPYAENYGEDNERITHNIFVFSAPVDNLAAATKFSSERTEGDITYYGITASGIMSNGNIVISTLGYANKKINDQIGSGDFAGTSKAFVYNGQALSIAPVATACSLATNGEYIAYQTISEQGVKIYNGADSSGIDDIVIGDENAPVEYYNLQGIRVDNPTPGMYIMRQGTKTSKVIIR